MRFLLRFVFSNQNCSLSSRFISFSMAQPVLTPLSKLPFRFDFLQALTSNRAIYQVSFLNLIPTALHFIPSKHFPGFLFCCVIMRLKRLKVDDKKLMKYIKTHDLTLSNSSSKRLTISLACSIAINLDSGEFLVVKQKLEKKVKLLKNHSHPNIVVFTHIERMKL
ncbi:unnamed protein product [Brassica rapa subsp. trilocularis]